MLVQQPLSAAPLHAQLYRQHGIEWPTVTVEYSNLNVSMEVSWFAPFACTPMHGASL